MRHIILISGKDSLSTALVQIGRAPNLPYELVHNDTGWDLPETMEWLKRVESHLDLPIHHCGDDLDEICAEENVLPTAFRRFCTRRAKIEPLNEYIGTDPVVVYFGLRADEPSRVGYKPHANQELTPCYPLRESGYVLNDVWRLCEKANLLPPSFHWQWIEDRVRRLLGKDSWLLEGVEPWDRMRLLAWRSRSNCDRCFYAAQYEKVGLYEHHPDRFEDACCLEERLCHGEEFSWAKGYRLRDLIPRADAIKKRRASQVVRYLRTKQVRYLFDDRPTDDLAVTSCGLLCGK